MKTFEDLKNDMIDAGQAYQKFIKENSRKLTNEEKINNPDYPTLIRFETEPHIFELTVDKLDEFNAIHKVMETARKKFGVEFRKKHKKNK